MSDLQRAIREHAGVAHNRIALRGASEDWTYGALNVELERMTDVLTATGIKTLGLIADNGTPWVLADLAALFGGIPVVPVPLFFSPQQKLHAMQDSGMDALLTDCPEQIALLLHSAGIDYQPLTELHGLQLIRLPAMVRQKLPNGTAKITYTSGTTGDPKGVCLSRGHMESVAESLRVASQANPEDKHLCLTPLSTLLENIGGVYVPLLAGACVCVPPLKQVGLQGAAGLDAAIMLQALHEAGATSAIMAPQMLQGLVSVAASGMEVPSSLRFVAVGGAPVSPQLLVRAQLLGIPVHEGYGLSECASVVALNAPGNSRAGSVGRPLPHVSVSFSQGGEVLVGGSAFLGYLGRDEAVQPWPTGDLGYLDDEGFLHLTGRKKSLFITSFGRNVAPEWVERELTMHPAVAQVAVFGESRPFNVAVIVPRQGYNREDIDAAIALANRDLPDYARISAWVAAHAPFTPFNGQLTSNGRLKREAIRAAYADMIEALYQEETHDIF